MSDYLEVLGTGVATAPPDVVVISARVLEDAPDVASALSGAASRMALVLDAAVRAAIEAPDRQTTGVGVHPRWDSQGQRVVGQQAFQTFTLTVRDAGRVGAILTALAEAGGDGFGLDDVRLVVGEPGALAATARERALADAAAKAEQLAALAGRGLGGIRRIVEAAPAGGGPVPVAARRLAYAADAAMPVEAGTSSVAVTLLIRYGWA